MFAGLPFLYSLDLSGNEVSARRIRIRSARRSLRIRNIQITTVEDFSFSRLNQLSLLNLCSNQLETLPPNTLFDSFKRSSTRARVLILNGPFVDFLSSLKLSDLDNPLNCDLRLAWLREWLRSNPDVQITTPGSKPTRYTFLNNLSNICPDTCPLICFQVRKATGTRRKRFALIRTPRTTKRAKSAINAQVAE